MVRSAVLVLVWLLSIGTAASADPWGQVERTVGTLPGGPFRDCDEGCPEMVELPAGSFTMGGTSLNIDEGPIHPVTIGYALAVGRYEVTFAEWDGCVRGGGCNGHLPRDNGWGRDRQPVMNVSWLDAQAYVREDGQALPPAQRGRVGICRPRRFAARLCLGQRDRAQPRQLQRLRQPVGQPAHRPRRLVPGQ